MTSFEVECRACGCSTAIVCIGAGLGPKYEQYRCERCGCHWTEYEGRGFTIFKQGVTIFKQGDTPSAAEDRQFHAATLKLLTEVVARLGRLESNLSELVKMQSLVGRPRWEPTRCTRCGGDGVIHKHMSYERQCPACAGRGQR